MIIQTTDPHPRALSAPSFAMLGRDVEEVGPCTLQVAGRLPEEISGTLYRNGPGRFTRGGERKRTLLDGDGVVQRLDLDAGRAIYSRRFVRTPKLAAEAKADRFLYPTWTSNAPGFIANLSQSPRSQAGVTVYRLGETLYALDEVAPGYVLDPESLATGAPAQLGLPYGDDSLKAHARQLADSGDWLFASTRMGREGMLIDFVRHRADGTRVSTPTVRAPRQTYVHDFVATDRYALVVLHAAHVHGLRYMLGLAAFSECLEWRPASGNIVLLVELATGTTRAFDAPAAWVWHLANGYEDKGCFIADFVGYDDPGHFLGEEAQLAAIMRGRDGACGSAGTLRRYVLDLAAGRLAETVIDAGNFEFCSVDSRCAGRAHRRIYATCGSAPGVLHTGIAAIDTATGVRDTFDFGPAVNAGEPVFVPRADGAPGEGWLITQTYDALADRSAFVVFDADHVAAGPMATIALPDRMAISFHGHWTAR